MDFREWLMNEMAHLMVEPPVEIAGKKVSFIDMQFELYPDMTNATYAKWIVDGFAAPIPGSSLWIVYDGRSAKARLSSSTEGKDKVPDDWWNRAYLSSNDDTQAAAQQA